jgi:hypothetical protein
MGPANFAGTFFPERNLAPGPRNLQFAVNPLEIMTLPLWHAFRKAICDAVAGEGQDVNRQRPGEAVAWIIRF